MRRCTEVDCERLLAICARGSVGMREARPGLPRPRPRSVVLARLPEADRTVSRWLSVRTHREARCDYSLITTARQTKGKHRLVAGRLRVHSTVWPQEVQHETRRQHVSETARLAPVLDDVLNAREVEHADQAVTWIHLLSYAHSCSTRTTANTQTRLRKRNSTPSSRSNTLPLDWLAAQVSPVQSKDLSL